MQRDEKTKASPINFDVFEGENKDINASKGFSQGLRYLYLFCENNNILS